MQETPCQTQVCAYKIIKGLALYQFLNSFL